MGKLRTVCALFVLLAGCGSKPDVDAEISKTIEGIKAIDNHAHPMRVTSAGEADTEFDALPVDAMQPAPLPFRLDAAGPDLTLAPKALFGNRAKADVMREKGDGYSGWVLDQMGIDIMLANRVSMGRGLPPERFKWVPFVDPLLFPLNNGNLAKRDPDRKTFFAAEEALLKRYLAEAGIGDRPRGFGEYLAFVTATLERMKRQGAVAVKFEEVYLRTLAWSPVERADADRTWSKAAGGVPADADYRMVQDYLTRHIAMECGRLGLAVHFHTGAGAGGYFDTGGSDPLLLEPLFNDPTLRQTKFVLLHGGWPWTSHTEALLAKPNVWADFSLQTLFFYPDQIAGTIRGWLEFMPDKVLFATDASPFTPTIGWEETGWMSATTGRRALALALSGMVRDGEITLERAKELARMTLRDNARKLYGWR